VEDMLARRTGTLFVDARASMESAERIAQLMSRELGRDANWQARQTRQFRELAESYCVS
jgi:glycerol-3-phosphate dehydrogenase